MMSVILAVALGAIVLFLGALWRLAGHEQTEMKEHAEQIKAACEMPQEFDEPSRIEGVAWDGGGILDHYAGMSPETWNAKTSHGRRFRLIQGG